MKSVYNTNNYRLRAALYLEYEGKCFYEGLPIRFKDMHIDHIIPQSITEDKLKTIIFELGLPSDFNVNSIYNLVPCSPNVNQVKNKNQYPNKFLGHCIYDGTSKKVDAVTRRIEQLSRDYKSDRELAELISQFSLSENKKDWEDLYNNLSNERPFDTDREVNKWGSTYTYKRSLPNIRLTAFLPVYPEVEGSCLITFSNLRLRDCMITLNHNQIMNQLFDGAGTSLNLKLRSFIKFSEEVNPDTYFIDIANVRFPLEIDEVIQLLDIIDDFYNLYMDESALIYNTLNRELFSSTGYLNRLRLFKIRKQLWVMILSFCRKFDYANGDTRWHIFDSSGSMLKVYDKVEGEYRLFIFPEREQEDFIVRTNDDIWLIWTDEFSWNKSLSDLVSNKAWSPLHSYLWLVNELIPQVIFQFENNNRKWYQKKIGTIDFMNKFEINQYAYSLPNIIDETNLLDYVSCYQDFFHIRPNEFFQIKKMNDIYSSLITIIEKSKIGSNEIHYVSSNLKLQNVREKEVLIQKISNLSTAEEEKVSSFFLDLVFRCMVVVLRDCRNILSEIEIENVKSKLKQQLGVIMKNEKVKSELIYKNIDRH